MAIDINTEKVPLKFIFVTGLDNCQVLLNAQQIVYVTKYDNYSRVQLHTLDLKVKETQAQIKALIEA